MSRIVRAAAEGMANRAIARKLPTSLPTVLLWRKLRPGLPERQTHDYQRHGTTTLFAALDVLQGNVIAECHSRRRHQEFLPFLGRINQSVKSGSGHPLGAR